MPVPDVNCKMLIIRNMRYRCIPELNALVALIDLFEQ